MSKIDDGGPAFPIPIAATTNGNGDPFVWDAQERCLAGMSLRAYIATKAMAALLEHCHEQAWTDRMKPLLAPGQRPTQFVAEMACDAADTLIAELKKGGDA